MDGIRKDIATMLPRAIYELLPYLYITIGVSTSLALSTGVIMVAAALLISAGLVILSMRFNYRRKLSLMLSNHPVETTVQRNYVSRRKTDRRQRLTTQFPLIDSAGNLVTADRRGGDRRSLTA